MTSKYKLYYNKQDGTPKYYSMEDLDEDYIDVDQKTFEASRYDIKVVDGKIKSLYENSISKYQLITESTDTCIMCDYDDISIIVNNSLSYKLWDYKFTN
jgi:hypothetical protein